ncbi:MAG: hypothetical protein ACK4YP_03860 [Myxococcota bacterium]
MSLDGRVLVAVAGEDEVHRALAMALFDAAARAHADAAGQDWFDVEHQRRWTTPNERDDVPERRRYFDTHREVELPGPTFRFSGRIDGKPLAPSARKLREMWLRHNLLVPRPALLVVLQDSDGAPGVVEGARQVVEWTRRQEGMTLVVGVPERDAEAWLLAGWRPTDPAEESRLRAARETLHFDPTTQPERLTAHPNDALTDAKRVLRYLVFGETPLTRGRPESRPPSAEQADELAAEMAADLARVRAHWACNLAGFAEDLHRAVVLVFRDRL